MQQYSQQQTILFQSTSSFSRESDIKYFMESFCKLFPTGAVLNTVITFTPTVSTQLCIN